MGQTRGFWVHFLPSTFTLFQRFIRFSEPSFQRTRSFRPVTGQGFTPTPFTQLHKLLHHLLYPGFTPGYPQRPGGPWYFQHPLPWFQTFSRFQREGPRHLYPTKGTTPLVSVHLRTLGVCQRLPTTQGAYHHSGRYQQMGFSGSWCHLGYVGPGLCVGALWFCRGNNTVWVRVVTCFFGFNISG